MPRLFVYFISSRDLLYIFSFVFSRLCIHYSLNCINAFLVSGYFCCLLITFANGLYKSLVLIWIQTFCHSDNVPERFFEEVNFDKKSEDDKKVLKLPSVQRGLMKSFTVLRVYLMQTCMQDSY